MLLATGMEAAAPARPTWVGHSEVATHPVLLEEATGQEKELCSGHGRGTAMVSGTVCSPVSLLGIDPSRQPQHTTCHTHSQPGTCLPASCPQFHPISLLTPSSSCRSQLFPYTHYYLGQGSTDIPSTLREINYPPCRWESYAMASSWRSPSCLTDHGLRAATMEPLGLPAAEQAPGAALDLPITG